MALNLSLDCRQCNELLVMPLCHSVIPSQRGPSGSQWEVQGTETMEIDPS